MIKKEKRISLHIPEHTKIIFYLRTLTEYKKFAAKVSTTINKRYTVQAYDTHREV